MLFVIAVANEIQNAFQSFSEKVQKSLELKTATFQSNVNQIHELDSKVQSLNKTISEFSKNVSFLYAATNEQDKK